MSRYVGVKIVEAEEAEKDGEAGYVVHYPSEPGRELYSSWCPKDVFERHNRRSDHLTFGMALECMRKGCRMARNNWNGKGLWVRMYQNDTSCFTHPFIVIEYPVGHTAYPSGSCIPWQASQTDMLADDWYIV